MLTPRQTAARLRRSRRLSRNRVSWKLSEAEKQNGLCGCRRTSRQNCRCFRPRTRRRYQNRRKRQWRCVWTGALFCLRCRIRPKTVFAEQLSAAVAGAKTYPQFNQLSAALWKAHGASLVDDITAQGLAEAIQSRKAQMLGLTASRTIKRTHGLPKPVKPRSSDRQASIERRRKVALCGAVPSRLAAGFTLSELATLSVIAKETKRHGSCQLHLDAIAALAGCCRTTVQNALRQAVRQGLIQVKERRRRGLRSLTNVVSIVSAEWRSWLKLGGRVQNSEHHVKQLFIHTEFSTTPPSSPIGRNSRFCYVPVSRNDTGQKRYEYGNS